MFPIPAIRFFPKLFKDDVKAQKLATLLDTEMTNVKSDILGMKRFYRPMECPVWALAELDFLLGSIVLPGDSEKTKRIKIKNATVTYSIRGSWADDVKIIIDAITGYDALQWAIIGGDDWIFWDASFDSSYYYAVMGCDGVDLNEGIALIGAGSEVAGNIYINLHYGITTGVLSAAQIAQIVASIETDEVPAYMRVYLGYLNSSGQFIIYTGGTIH